MSVNWCRTNYTGSRQGKFEQCCNYSMLHSVLCHRKPLCRHLDNCGNEDVRRGEETNGLQWSSRSRRIMALGYGSYVSTDWVKVKFHSRSFISNLYFWINQQIIFEYFRLTALFNTWLKLELIKRTRPKKNFLKGLKLVLVNNVSVVFYQLTPSLCIGVIK